MPSYVVTLKDDATSDQVRDVKRQAIDQGGKITQEYNLIKGFSVQCDQGALTALETNPAVAAVEEEGISGPQ